MSVLKKADVEALLSDYDHDPVAALRRALALVLDLPDASWPQLLKAAPFTCARRIRLQVADQAALDELAAELNELRALAAQQ